jgi:hypothetical protein
MMKPRLLMPINIGFVIKSDRALALSQICGVDVAMLYPVQCIFERGRENVGLYQKTGKFRKGAS